MRLGGTILNNLKGVGTEKRREETKILKWGGGGGQAGAVGGCLKKRWAGTPLRTMPIKNTATMQH